MFSLRQITAIFLGVAFCLESYGQYKPLPPIGRTAYDLILHHEVSSRRFYDSIYSRPAVPGAQSGVTIGIGYDLGYKTRETFYRDWGRFLSARDMKRLEACLGLTQGRARRMLPSISDIVIPWEHAEQVFQSGSLPDAIQDTLRAFPGAERLPPDAFGVLVSLVFNRGGSVHDRAGSNRRKEMMEIRKLISSGNYRAIPNSIRSMKRIWQGQGVPGLLRRREDEATLLEVVLNGGSIQRGYFDSDPSDIRANPVVRTYASTQLAESVRKPMSQAEAEDVRSFLFQNAEVVASSLSARIEGTGNRNVIILKLDEKEDMLWVSEFRDLVVRNEQGQRVFEDKRLGKYIKVDVTELAFTEYPPSEVNRILALTQNLLRIQIPSPLLAQWAGGPESLPIANPPKENAVQMGSVIYN